MPCSHHLDEIGLLADSPENALDRQGRTGPGYFCSCGTEVSHCRTCTTFHPTSTSSLVDLAPGVQRYYCATCATQIPSCPRCGVSCDASMLRDVPDLRPCCPRCLEQLARSCSSCDQRFYTEDPSAVFCLSCNHMREMTENPSYLENPDPRRIGFELEFLSRREPALVWGRLHGDGSVHAQPAREGGQYPHPMYPHEFSSVPVSGDHAFKAIRETCSAILAAGGLANWSCGFHLHLDMTNSSADQRLNIQRNWLVYEDLFFALVEHNEHRFNQFARRGVGTGDRYQALNIEAFREHHTFEIRLHHGTVDPEEVLFWAKLQLLFFRTHEDRSLSSARQRLHTALSHRAKLLLFFSNANPPLALRKDMLRRLRLHDELCPRKKKGKYLDLSKKQKQSAA